MSSSLFGSLQLSANTLRAMQVGLQVTGNNIANANTPGYIRERALLTPAPTQGDGHLLTGLGVQVTGVVQEIDIYLRERVRGALSDVQAGETKENAFGKLEAVIGELSDTDLSTSLDNFFGSIQDVLNQPESPTVRNLAVLRGKTLADDVKRLNDRVLNIRDELNDRVVGTARDINSLTTEIAHLNVRIVGAEGGITSKSDAVGLRDQRQIALDSLAKLVGIRAVEQESGSVSVYVGSDYLVTDGLTQDVSVTYESDRGSLIGTVNVANTAAPLQAASGELAGLYEARDDVIRGFLDRLDGFAGSLINEFNKVFSGGQGLSGYTELTGEYPATATNVPLDEAGLPFTPVNGTFQIQVTNTRTNVTETSDVTVRLNGLDDDTTLDGLVAQLDGIDGIRASLTPEKQLTIEADSPNLEFAFASDTSGVLSALGINVFFRGSTASDIGVRSEITDDPGKFAASGGGVGQDSRNAERLAGLLNEPLESEGGQTLAGLYDKLIGDTTQAAAVTKAVTDGYRVFHRTLDSQSQSITGVSLDEEAVKMIAYQRGFQAAAKFIGTVGDLLDILVQL